MKSFVSINVFFGGILEKMHFINREQATKIANRI